MTAASVLKSSCKLSRFGRCHLVHDFFEIEAGRLLPGWELLEGGYPLRHHCLRWHHGEHPVRHPFAIKDAVIATFKGICAKVVEVRKSQIREFLLPHCEPFSVLFFKNNFPVLDTNRHQVAVVAPIKKSLARRFFGLALEERDEVVPIEVYLEGSTSHFVSLTQLFHNLRLTGCGCKRRNEVFMSAHVIDDRSGPDDAGPANDTWHAKCALPVRVLLTSKRCTPAI